MDIFFSFDIQGLQTLGLHCSPLAFTPVQCVRQSGFLLLMEPVFTGHQNELIGCVQL